MMAKGKRKVILEFGGKQFSNGDLEKEVFAYLKDNHGIKYSNNIETYVNFHEGMIYSVVNDHTYSS